MHTNHTQSIPDSLMDELERSKIRLAHIDDLYRRSELNEELTPGESAYLRMFNQTGSFTMASLEEKRVVQGLNECEQRYYDVFKRTSDFRIAHLEYKKLDEGLSPIEEEELDALYERIRIRQIPQ